MDSKINCWEFHSCGREPGGEKAYELGICSAAICESFDGKHGGKNAGRDCWSIAGTLCKGAVQGTAARKMMSCLYCEFYAMVIREEKGLS